MRGLRSIIGARRLTVIALAVACSAVMRRRQLHARYRAHVSALRDQSLRVLDASRPVQQDSGKLVLDRAAKTGSVEITRADRLDRHRRPEARRASAFAGLFQRRKNFRRWSFKAKTIRFNGDVPASAEGELTLLGVTRPLTLSISNVVCAPASFLTRKRIAGPKSPATQTLGLRHDQVHAGGRR